MREASPETPEAMPESVLVRLASLQATGKDIAELESTDWEEFATDIKDPIRTEAHAAHGKHVELASSDPALGNWPPTPDQIRLFDELSRSITVS